MDELEDSGTEGMSDLVEDIDYSTRNEAFRLLPDDETRKDYLKSLVSNPDVKANEFKATLVSDLEIRGGGTAFVRALNEVNRNSDIEAKKVLINNFDKFVEAFSENMPSELQRAISLFEQAKKQIA